jgi:prevent-host-death family protein
MQQYNIHTAKTHLSALVEKAANGEEFIIAKSGKPLVKVSTDYSQGNQFCDNIKIESSNDAN